MELHSEGCSSGDETGAKIECTDGNEPPVLESVKILTFNGTNKNIICYLIKENRVS